MTSCFSSFKDQVSQSEKKLKELQSEQEPESPRQLGRHGSAVLSQEVVGVLYVTRNSDFSSDQHRPSFKEFVKQLEGNMHLCDIRASYEARRYLPQDFRQAFLNMSGMLSAKSEKLFCVSGVSQEDRDSDQLDTLGGILYASPPTESSQRVTSF